ncbi:MAG: SDR family oxidoreductase [Fimbriimonadaceae bacterium]|nr:SDR family oxidoreductase [Fimbriimonadaceae bacterium]
MDLGIAGKVAMVAAGSKGIGRATAKLLAQEGCHVSICGRDETSLRAAQARILTDSNGAKVHICQADVTQSSDLERWFGLTVDELGPASILVTNTGGPPAGLVDSLTDEQWQLGFDSTIMNIVRLCRLAVPTMKASSFGRIVHITSLVAKEPSQLLAISSTLRAGIMGLIRVQATEYAEHNITVNGVLPGHTLTDRQTHLAEIRAEREGITVDQALQNQAAAVPMKRLADADEIAAAIVFLCSMQAGYVTGTNLLVDGGLTKGLA